MSTPFVITLTTSAQNNLRTQLEEKDFTFSQPQNTIFQAQSKSVTCTLYSSGKLVIQGKGAQEFIEFFLEPEVLHRFTHTALEQDLRPRLGVDESGKGDFFGPLCIAGVYADQSEILKKLYDSNVQDSKNLKDSKIISLARIIRSLCVCDLIILYPEKYNELYRKFHNLNKLLAWAHATIINNLAPRPSGDVFAISDQFASSKQTLLNALKQKATDISVIQKTHAEQDVIVAAASIIARDAFVNSIQKLEQKYQLQLPKGSGSNVKETAKVIAKQRGKDFLEKISKTHFKTFEEI
ncbi:Ribonuclease HIII,ribonuclease HIII,ribonuclease HIII,Ribonuclease HII [Chlamydia serpentis]|uniref:Ribonuclease HIII n=1 Tax=Chlamydia serpentis TaxID=1967782 RepID=A0A2R8FCS1_9CHLA|nr:ribonuclease HIII [Chlamydia serpentis]SPN74171.1 Ribonuclease HIII,ribonuclease HIII,ribonuclease HIII,Ribonuclease HII [Chlamydia serpentis]